MALRTKSYYHTRWGSEFELGADRICELTAKAFALAGNIRDKRQAGFDSSPSSFDGKESSTEFEQDFFHIDQTVGALPGFACPPRRGCKGLAVTKTIKPGQWTIIIVDERHDHKEVWKSYLTETKLVGLRYAFITSNGSEKLTASSLDVNMRIPAKRQTSLAREHSYDGTSNKRPRLGKEGPAPVEIDEYKDSIVVADLEQFLRLTLPGDMNEELRFRLNCIWDERIEEMERDLKHRWERIQTNFPPHGAEPIVVNKTSVCSPDEVEEVLRFFLEAE